MSDPATAYRVLARKYRPQTFAELIGQEAMVRTLTNAIAAGRIAHAFILTGVRGVGKTTTARIIARALNCVGPDGAQGPTDTPCGRCVHCTAIADDRHMDVIEMDAASRTGVDDIRELTEGVRYRPVSARYKVYIIDEVHMLSKNAFNALLKTLEEPPEHVKFVFATTEVQKVPVTVLSRCQRFSLRRVPPELLIEHYRRVAEQEAVAVEPAALALIARAADGSVRDGLSLLDQAIALAGDGVTATAVRDMLGIADRGLVFDLLESVLGGDAAGALARMNGLYEGGADPQGVLQDLLELCHLLTRLKLAPEAGVGDPIIEGDRGRALPLAAKLAMPALARAWQMLLKGLEEVQVAPSPKEAADMVLVRLAYVADLPSPAELVRTLAAPAAAAPATERAAPRTAAPSAPTPAAGPVAARALPEPLAEPSPAPSALQHDPMPQSFAEIVALFDAHREALLRSHLWAHAHLVRFEPGRIELRLDEAAPSNLAGRLSQLLGEWTGARWVVAVSDAEGEPSLKQQEDSRERAVRGEIAGHPLVQAVLEAFPGATIAAVRDRAATDAEAAAAGEPETPELEPGEEDEA